VLVACELARIVRRPDPNEGQYIYLVEKGGARALPIVIGKPEADEIYRKFMGKPNPRPFTHDLLREMLSQLGGRIEGVEVVQLKEGTFHAKLVIRCEDRQLKIDCRPSDGIALAVAEDAPISVDEKVFDDATNGA